MALGSLHEYGCDCWRCESRKKDQRSIETDIRKCPLHGEMYLTKAFDVGGIERTILECPKCDHQQRVLTAEDIERIGKKAAEANAVIRGGNQRF